MLFMNSINDNIEIFPMNCGSCSRHSTCPELCSPMLQKLYASPGILKDERSTAKYELKALSKIYDSSSMGHGRRGEGGFRHILDQDSHQEEEAQTQEVGDSFFEKHERTFKKLSCIDLGVFAGDPWKNPGNTRRPAVYFYSYIFSGKKTEMAELCGVTPKTISLDCKAINDLQSQVLGKVQSQHGRSPANHAILDPQKEPFLLYQLPISVMVAKEIISSIPVEGDPLEAKQLFVDFYLDHLCFCLNNGGPSVVPIDGLMRFYKRVSYERGYFDIRNTCLPPISVFGHPSMLQPFCGNTSYRIEGIHLDFLPHSH